MNEENKVNDLAFEELSAEMQEELSNNKGEEVATNE